MIQLKYVRYARPTTTLWLNDTTYSCWIIGEEEQDQLSDGKTPSKDICVKLSWTLMRG